MMQRLKRTPGIYLVGFMGCGKSTLGRLLAQEIGWRFVDLDEAIEQQMGSSVPALFDQLGEPGFRQIESATLAGIVQRVERGEPHVVALGGGAYVQPQNAELVKNNGVTIYLDCPLPVLEQRVGRNAHRPLARDPMRFRQLFHERAPLYARADYRVEVGDAPASEHLKALLNLPLFHE